MNAGAPTTDLDKYEQRWPLPRNGMCALPALPPRAVTYDDDWPSIEILIRYGEISAESDSQAGTP
jgi:hypothetical protein